MQTQELVKLNLGYKIQQIKKGVSEEVERQNVAAVTKQEKDFLVQKDELTGQTTSNTPSYQRQRRVERNTSYYDNLENEIDENEKISHHR